MLDKGEIWLQTPLSRCPWCHEPLGDNPYHAPTSPWFCSVEHYAAWRDQETSVTNLTGDGPSLVELDAYGDYAPERRPADDG